MKKNKLIIATTLDVVIKNEEFYMDILVCSAAADLLEKAFEKPDLLKKTFFTYKDFSDSIEKWIEHPQEFWENTILSSEMVAEETIFLLVVHPYCADDLFDLLNDVNNLYQKFDVIDFDELEEGADEDLIDKGEIVSISIEKTRKVLPDYLKN